MDGQFGGWAPIGAEKTATGYQVAWKDASTGLYTAWNTDNNGNYVSHISALTGFVSGTNTALKSLETSFNQDLNGDGSIAGSSGECADFVCRLDHDVQELERYRHDRRRRRCQQSDQAVSTATHRWER